MGVRGEGLAPLSRSKKPSIWRIIYGVKEEELESEEEVATGGGFKRLICWEVFDNTA